jgi:hypothetical protein
LPGGSDLVIISFIAKDLRCPERLEEGNLLLQVNVRNLVWTRTTFFSRNHFLEVFSDFSTEITLRRGRELNGSSAPHCRGILLI